MYPTIVMLLVENQRSMTDVCEISPSYASKFVGQARVASEARHAKNNLSFPFRPVHTTTDSEAESQRSHALQSQSGQEHG